MARLLMVACFLGAAPLPAQQSLPPDLVPVFERGVQALKGNHLDEAEESFQEVLRRGGKEAFVYSNLGIVFQRRANHEKAAEEFREAIRLDPQFTRAHILLGASLLVLGDAPGATRELEIATHLEPREPLAHLELARAHERAGNIPGMVEEYRILKQLSPQNPEYAYQLGRAYQKLAQWSLGELIRLNPGSARLDQAKAESYQAQGHLDLAIRSYEHAAQLNSQLPGVHLALAEIYLQQEKRDEARRELQQELAIVPESASARALEKKLAEGAAPH